MKINDDHMYHGAALTQIAEHKQFTAINAFEHGSKKSRSAFIVNRVIGVYLKYAGGPVGKSKEYLFTFLAQQLSELDSLEKKTGKVCVALVCVKDRQICGLPLAQLREPGTKLNSGGSWSRISPTVATRLALWTYML